MDTLIEEPQASGTTVDTPTTPAEGTDTVDTPKEGAEDAATLKKRLADKDRYIKDLEADRKKAEKLKGEPVTRGELEETKWEIEHKDEISLVNDDYERIKVEGYHGEKVSKKVALALALKEAKIDNSGAKRDRQDDMSTPSVTNRNADPKGYETDSDRALGLTLEKKRKLEARHPHLKAD